MLFESLMLGSILAGLLLLRIYLSQRYWQQKGVLVPGLKFPLGNHPCLTFDWKLKQKDMLTVSREQYQEVKGKASFYGGYTFRQRFLVITDPDLIKDVMIKNFNCFVDKQAKSSDSFMINNDTLADKINAKQFIALKGDEWKDARTAFSPIFTSGKMKAMFPLIEKTSESLLNTLVVYVEEDKAVDLKDLFGKFSMDTIASCAFGVDAKSFDVVESDFVHHAKNVFKFSLKDLLKIFLLILIPGMTTIFKWLKISLVKTKEILFFYNVIKSTMEHRCRMNIRRNDLVDMMLDIIRADQKSISDTTHSDHEKEDKDKQYHKDAKLTHVVTTKKSLDELVVVASAFNLLSAGYDTTSLALSYLGHQLALNTDIQTRIQVEIDDVLEEKDIPTYGDIAKMGFLHASILETIRMHPPLAFLQRGCTADYQIPGIDIWIRKGEEVFINVGGLHFDPEYYPEPDTFNPENFTKEARELRHPYAFLGFGQGPRNCMGMRFALMEAKMVMARILSKCSFVKCEETPETLTLDPTSILGSCKEKLMVKLHKRMKVN